MKYLGTFMKAEIMIIGLLMMYFHPVLSSPPFMSGLAIFTIGLFLGLQWYFGESFSGCIFKKAAPEIEKKKWLFWFKK